jgi:hypothetical protein
LFAFALDQRARRLLKKLAKHPDQLVREMKMWCEGLSEAWAAAAAILWFVSARFRLMAPRDMRRGLESGFEDPKAVLMLIYRQSRWSAWAAIAAGFAALFAIADGLLPNT